MSDGDADNPMDTLLSEAGESEQFDWGDEELDEAVTSEFDVLRFNIGGQLFALEGDAIREIVGEVEITPLPGAPSHIRGICVIKRQVIGVLDLASWLGLPGNDEESGTSEGELYTRVLILESGDLVAGVVADEVTGIEPWPANIDAATLPENISDRLRRFTRGGQWAPGGIVLLLDMERILEEAAVR